MQDETSAGSSSDTSGSSNSSLGSSASARSSVSPSSSNSSTTTASAKTSTSSAASASSTTPTSSTTPPKKTRSQSPGAVQRRRIQNRIAQRNHRQKVKERAAEEKERLALEQAHEKAAQQAHLFSSRSSTASISSNSSLTNYPAQFSNGVPDHSQKLAPSPIQIPGARPPSGTMNGWLPDPTLLPTPDGDLAAYATDYLNISCSCNSLTGPCAHHREEMRVQFLGFMSSPQNEPNMGSQKKAFANPMGDVLLDKLMQQPLPSPPLFPEMQTPVDQGRHTGFHTSNVSSSTSGSASPRDGPGNTTTATNTSRFKAILTFVRAAGFPDFDSMVTSYYTSSFQKNSVADLAQRSSRGRKLGSVLENLHESASKWTVWESRQYREKVVEAAQSMYIQELDQVIKRARRRQQQQQSMPSSAHSQQDVLMFGADECSEASVSSAASMESMAGGAMPPLPEEMGRVFQDNLPNLWALLTELAGTQGLQCDRVALAALLLLYNARQNPDIDVDELVPDWRNPQAADLS